MSKHAASEPPTPITRAKTLTASHDPRFQRLSATVEDVWREFSTSVERQEGRGGFFGFLTLAAPCYLSFLDKLRGDHRELLGALAALKFKLDRPGSAPWEEVLAEFDAVMAAIRDHEELEDCILRDALEHVE